MKKEREKTVTGWDTLPCPVCGGTRFTELFRKHGEPFSKCHGCGLVLINPRPVYAEVLQTYDADYSRAYAGKTDSKRRRAARTVRRLRRVQPAGRWLDVGCSAGFIVEAAKKSGYEAHGIDVEAWGIEHARKTLGLENVRQGFLEDQGYADGFFNVITSYEVIEHVPDLNRFVAELKRLLAPGGILEISTPDIGHWRRPRKLETWNAILPSEHLYYFSLDTLSRLLKKHKLVIARKRFNLKPGLKVQIRHSDDFREKA
jgi:2-polyprenyl-3-methyl-5-hydroxy-6-metoxy-1,4-benzoquinol methylase